MNIEEKKQHVRIKTQLAIAHDAITCILDETTCKVMFPIAAEQLGISLEHIIELFKEVERRLKIART